MNNPLKYTDPTGHMQTCGNGYDECGPDPSQRWAMLIYENYEQMMGEMEIWMRDHPDISYIAGMGKHLEDMEPLLMSREFTSIFSTQYRGDTLPGIADDPLGKAYAGAAFMLIGGGTFAWGAYSAQREIGKPTLGTFWSDVKGDPGLPESYNGATIEYSGSCTAGACIEYIERHGTGPGFQRHAHGRTGTQRGRGPKWAINEDGSAHDGNYTRIPKQDAIDLRKKGFTIPKDRYPTPPLNVNQQ